MHSIKIRMATLADAKALLAIYRPYVENTVISFEYDVPSEEEFRSRIAHTLEKYPYLVAEKEGKLLGYAYASPFKTRAAYDWAVETTIYLDETSKGLGIGRQLYEILERILSAQNIININACIAYANPESIKFHEKLGYKTVAHFTKCGYKLGQWQDMIWMEKILKDHPIQPKRIIPIGELELTF
ncbi:MAG: N-acetyltransferase [Cellulosilyticum sp.]|nr:N-acetyltransferase [Cellulosilyticum sp.]